jgi:hypothetical protein
MKTRRRQRHIGGFMYKPTSAHRATHSRRHKRRQSRRQSQRH